MSIDDKIPSGDVKDKLRHLPESMGLNEVICDFVNHFAVRLPLNMSPMDYVITFNSLLKDAEAGVDHLTKRRLYGAHVKVPSGLYELVHMYIPCFSKATCPHDFAKRVTEIYDY